MSQFFALCSLLVFFFFSTAQATSLQFSNQAPLLEDELDLLVNGQVVPDFANVSYPEVRGFVDLIPYQEEPESTLFTLTVLSSTTGQIIGNGTYDLSYGNYTSYFIANSGNDDYPLQSPLASFALDQPTEFYGWVRFINLAPTDEDKFLWVNGTMQQPLAWGVFTSYAVYRAGEYLVQIVESISGPNLATLNLIVVSGQITTVIFNGVGDVLLPYTLETNVDLDFSADYPECYVRFVNSLSDDVTPYFVPGDLAPFEEVESESATDYQPLPVGEYVLFLEQDSTVGPSVNFTCESSHAYTFTYQGDGSDTSFSVLNDRVLKPSYLEAGVRVDLLTIFENADETSLVVAVDGVAVEPISYTQPTNYLKVETTSPTFSISQGETVLYEEKLELKLGETFSWFVLGSADAPTSLLTSDSEGVSTVDPTTTTTTTTTGSTTGESTTGAPSEDDDDGDDGLSGGAIAGIVIAVLIVFFGLVAGLVVFLRRRGYSST